MTLEIDFAGTIVTVDHTPFVIGRTGDLAVDGNPFLHRSFLTIDRQRGMWLLHNVGQRLTATVSDVGGRLEAFLAPGAMMPLVAPETVVRFGAGPTTYELLLRQEGEAPPVPRNSVDEGGQTTRGRVSLTADQRLLIVALAEPALRGIGRSATSLPSSSEAATRLGWTITKFNRKLDNVCAKLAATGVRGMHGSLGALASSRRARLVEFALATGVVSASDLPLLDIRHDSPGPP